MNNRIVLIAGCLATLSAIGLAYAQGKRPLRVVSEVDLARYAGQWYEIARFPNRFQKRCAGEVTAQYALQPSGKISVLNRCRLENGGQIQAEGVLSFRSFRRFGVTIRSLRSRRITHMRL
ncbi:MAG TPA: lipocalin family protein [Terriglobia bacterium]|nr:lipocalin family protein [Terriglobia bacterium]